MTQFKKLAAFSDIHFGEHGNSKEHNLQCLEFIDWFIQQSEDCDVLLFGGDWHHHRHQVGSETLKYSYEGVRRLAETGKEVWFIIGNHDLPYLDRRDVHSIPYLESFKTIRTIDKPQTIGNFLLVPWITTDDDLSLIKRTKAQYAFGHFEFGGFKMNEAYDMPFRDGHLEANDLEMLQYVFAGHFHMRQQRKLKSGTHVHYIGNPFPHSFSDVGDRFRGMMTLENGGTPKYIDWEDMPTYDRVLVSQMDSKLPLLGRRSTVEIIQDVDMSPTERDELRSFLLEEVGVRVATINPLKVDSATVDIVALAQKLGGNESVSEIVTKFLGELSGAAGTDSFGLDKNRLIEIYIKTEVH